MREWIKVSLFEHPNWPTKMAVGERNDGQYFYVNGHCADGRNINDEELKAQLDTFLDERCICQIPPTGKSCPVETEIFKHGHQTSFVE